MIDVKIIEDEIEDIEIELYSMMQYDVCFNVGEGLNDLDDYRTILEDRLVFLNGVLSGIQSGYYM
ncbi:hypothetical protein ACF8R8_20975 [Enterobacter cloacae complex sp. FYR_6]|uniref:hypothetical protein n=1 Tax=Enterobacteriaceae TaxID=543 RepID=UPI0006503973|nr:MULTISPECIES: hypothetical protein [Enterobacteriaceae]KMK01315.1 hypothetical protein ABW07_24200 [Pluralibacter gergoviae]KMK30242.1 hypothetical protein ABW11_01505 [Pluralibacter gergoviae]MBY5148650.1 hypothetical protein [Enterobacter hormaechei]